MGYVGFFGGEESRTISHEDDKIVVRERIFYNGAADDGQPLCEGRTWSISAFHAIKNLLFYADTFILGKIVLVTNGERSMIYYDDLPLDRTLISGIDHLPDKQENVRNLVLEFHSRGILVVAEGVEEKEEFDYLVGLGVDLYQGYYLARPA